MLMNLLARIHRDGGHYTESNGVDKSARDADKIIAALFAERDEAIAKCASIISFCEESNIFIKQVPIRANALLQLAPAIHEFLAWENSGDHTDAEWLEQTEKLAKLANAVKEPT